MKKIKLAIVDDHEIFRDGLRLVLEQIKEFEVVVEYESGDELLRHLDDVELDVILLDINMPGTDGIKATELVKARKPDLGIIGLSMQSDQISPLKMIKNGADGFVQKKSGKYELEQAIHSVYQGGNYFSQEILKLLAGKVQKGRSEADSELTEREHDVLVYICQGLSTKEIAEELFLSPKTIEIHRANLMSKTACKNSAQLVIWAIRNHKYSVF